MTLPVTVQTNSGTPVSVQSMPALPAGTNAIGKLAANSGVDIGDVDVTSLPTVSTATLAAVASSASNVTIKAANAARKGLVIVNTDANALYIKFGATASLTSFTAIIGANQMWEMPANAVYTGIVDGIWAADGSGSAYVTEL